MRTMMKVTIPMEIGNTAIKDGSLPKLMLGFVERHKPEVALFFPENGQRTALFVLDLPDSATLPSIAEPFFGQLQASVHLTPAMNANELKEGMERLKKM